MPSRAGILRFRTRSPRTAAFRALGCTWVLLALVLGGPWPSDGGPGGLVHGGPPPMTAAQNSSTNPYGLCPSGGTEFLGVDWNCVALLNLTVVLLMLGAVGIIAYVFWNSDAAEFPGESAEVPLTDEEWAEEKARRRERMAEAESARSEASNRRGP